MVQMASYFVLVVARGRSFTTHLLRMRTLRPFSRCEPWESDCRPGDPKASLLSLYSSFIPECLVHLSQGSESRWVLLPAPREAETTTQHFGLRVPRADAPSRNTASSSACSVLFARPPMPKAGAPLPLAALILLDIFPGGTGSHSCWWVGKVWPRCALCCPMLQTGACLVGR